MSKWGSDIILYGKSSISDVFLEKQSPGFPIFTLIYQCERGLLLPDHGSCCKEYNDHTVSATSLDNVHSHFPAMLC